MPTRRPLHELAASTRRFRTSMAVLALVGAAVSFVFSLVVFPEGSPVVDERVYVQEGRALSEGALVLPPEFVPDHVPFLTATNDRGEVVFKYTHAWPSVLAASYRLFGTERPATALMGAAGVLAVGALALGVTGRRDVALLAGALLVVCPLWLVLSASFLSYAFSLSCGLGASALLLLDTREPRRWYLPAAGLLAGLAVWARAYDAIFMVGPAAVLWVVEAWPVDRRVLGRAVSGLLGLVPGVAVLLATNHRITGNVFQLGYSLVGPYDDLGFGPRRDTATGPPYDYGVDQALVSLRDGLLALARWTPGYVLGIALALAGFVALRGAQRWLMVAYAVAFPAAYFFVWGAWNAHTRLKSADVMGPYYYLPTAAVLAVLAAVALTHLRPPRAGLLAVGGSAVALAVSLVVLWPAIDDLADHRRFWREWRQDLEAVTPDGPSVIMFESTPGPDTEPALGFGDIAYNDVDLANHTVYAIARPERVGAVARRFPDREIVYHTELYVLPGRPGEPEGVDGFGFGRRPQFLTFERIDSSTARFTVSLPPGVGEPVDLRLYVATAQGAAWRPFEGPATTLGYGELARALRGGPGWERAAVTAPPATVCVGLSEGPPESASRRDEACFPVDEEEGTLFAPGLTATALRGPEGPTVMVPTDVGDRLLVQAVGEPVS